MVFVDDVAEVPAGAPLMLSAHGSAPEVVAAARARGGVVVDAVCPLVTKVHHELRVRANKGYTVLYVGHAGHEEAVGTMAVAPEPVRLIETEADLEGLDIAGRHPGGPPGPDHPQPRRVAGLMESARRRFPELWMPNRSDLCFATTNRQAALKAIAGRGRRRGGDRLGQLVEHRGPGEGGPRPPAAPGWCGSTRPTSSPTTSPGTVGVTAGASAPEALVRGGHRPPGPRRGVVEAPVTTEDEYFPPPPELREQLRALAAALAACWRGPARAAGTRWATTGPSPPPTCSRRWPRRMVR